jgi:hypothetical protein
MLTYNSSLQNKPPIDDAQRNQALDDLRRRSPYGAFGQNHQDVLNSLTDNAANTLNMEAYRANADYQMQQQRAQQQLILSGLQQQSEAEQNQRNLGNTRLQNMVGFTGNLLGGLFN